MKPADVALAGTVTEVGTVTAALLLDSLTTSPPAGAGVPRLAVHASVPAPEMELLAQEIEEIELIADIPAALMFTVILPVEELLAIVRIPVNVLTWGEVKLRVSVAVWPGVSVAGVVTPDAANKEPATDRLEIVTGAAPVDLRVIDFLAVCPATTLPKSTLVELTLKVAAPATPAALVLITTLPCDELLATVTIPVNVLTWGELKLIVSVAVWPGLRVSGVLTPEAVNREPTTEIPEIVTGAVPVDFKVTVFFAVCPAVTSPKETLVELTLRVGVPELACAKLPPQKGTKSDAAMARIFRKRCLRKTSPLGSRGTSGSLRCENKDFNTGNR